MNYTQLQGRDSKVRGRSAIAVCTVVLSLPLWIAWWWFVRHKWRRERRVGYHRTVFQGVLGTRMVVS